MDLKEIREQLDSIDAQLSNLIEKRIELCGEVAAFKMGTGKSVYDGKREEEKLDAVRSMAHSEFNSQALEELFKQMMTVSRRYQYALMQKQGIDFESGFTKVDGIETKGARVVYQGVEGAYSHAAALRFFGENADFYHVSSWEEAMQDVQEKKADYAVLPLENSSAGMVDDNYDLLFKYKNYIVGELYLPVSHALLGLPESTLSEIRTVYSHPQALMQCSEFLNRHENWKQISVENTAVAAKRILAENDRSQAAVASETAGKLYGLKVLEQSINHNKENTTRFIIVGNSPVYAKNAGRISMMFELPHKSGSLYNMIGNFIFNGINMDMIQSRPIPERNWEYRFYVDIDGNLGTAAVCNALMALSHEAAYMRILGNY